MIGYIILGGTARCYALHCLIILYFSLFNKALFGGGASREMYA